MGDEPDRVAMVSDLRAESGALRTEMTTMRDQLSARIDQVETKLANRIEEVNSNLTKRIEEVNSNLTKRIEEEGKTTRRHFDVMVEDVKAAVKLVAEVTAHHAVVLDDHETRLTQIEKAR